MAGGHITAKKEHSDSLAIGVLAGVIDAVVPAACRLVEHLDGDLTVTFVEAGEQAAGH